jgi:hypothetical protein
MLAYLNWGPSGLGSDVCSFDKKKIKFLLFGMFAPNAEHFAVWLVTC